MSQKRSLDGTRIGRYRVLATLGAGGMATVYRVQRDDGATFALKMLHPGTVAPEEKRRFEREFETLSKMDHPHIVRVAEAGIHDLSPYIVMELVDGPDLDGLLAAWKTAPPPDRFERIERIFRGICSALQYLHGRSLIHRDLKPSNILVHRDGTPKITDFGVVKDPDAAWTQLTMAGRLVGTVAFMAPEQISGEKLDARVDLYAAGAVLYVMLAGRRPIEANSVAGYLARHLTEVPPAPSTLDPSIPTRLERVCLRLLSKDPAQRFASARAVLDALDRPEADARPPLRGREEAMRRVGDRLAELVAGSGGTLAVIGPEGSGRSHVLDAVIDVAKGLGVATVSVPAGPGRTLKRLASALSAPGPDALALALRDEPTLIAVDDLDIDPSGAKELARLVRDRVTVNVTPLLLVFTAADAEGHLAALLSGANTGIPAERLDLGPLDRRAVARILRDAGVPPNAAPVLAKRLHEDHDGQPGAVLQQLEALRDAGWLAPAGDGLKLTRPVEDLRTGELPVPSALRLQVEAAIAGLELEPVAVLRALATLSRPAAPELLSAATGVDVDDAMMSLEPAHLVKRASSEEGGEVLRLAHPGIGTVALAALDATARRAQHAAVARALGARKRQVSPLELGEHLRLAGDAIAAYPQYVAAARRAARANAHSEVLEVCRKAAAIRAEVEPKLPPDEAVRSRRWLAMLEGEALLTRGEWSAAIPVLGAAVTAAEAEPGGTALARCLANLGRALYRKGDFAAAEPLLTRAITLAEPGAPEKGSALRALADLALRKGDVPLAERLWSEALDLAIGIASRDAQARARRGLAHVRVLQGRLSDGAALLDAAEDLLAADGDPFVHAGILARGAELDWAAGRFAAGLRRTDALIEILGQQGVPERLAEAHALAAELWLAIGDKARANAATKVALSHLASAGAQGWEVRLRVGRVLCGLGQVAEVDGILPSPAEVRDERVDDPAAQLAALRARALASSQPQTARDLAAWTLVRPAPLLAVRGAKIATDTALAFTATGATDAARQAVKAGLRALTDPATDGLRLMLLLAMRALQDDERVRGALAAVAGRIAAALPAEMKATFLEQAGLSDLGFG